LQECRSCRSAGVQESGVAGVRSHLPMDGNEY
jgi:hypothetical protein